VPSRPLCQVPLLSQLHNLEALYESARENHNLLVQLYLSRMVV
jgi:hypothetical protein